MAEPLSSRPLRRLSRRQRRLRREQRGEEDLKLFNLIKELRLLAEKYGRFRKPIGRLRDHVESQLFRPRVMEDRVVRMLVKSRLLSLEEIMEDTDLDEVSATRTLGSLSRKKKVEMCARDGSELLCPRPYYRPYYRLAGPRRPPCESPDL